MTWSRSPGTAPLPPDGDAAILAGFEAWKGPDRAVDFARGETPDEVPEPVQNYRNDVWLVEQWPFEGDDALARASVWVDPGGNIISFDIAIDGREEWTTDGDPEAWDLQAAVTHEVGHALGLDHSAVSEAVMWASAGLGASRRELAPDDEEAIRLLYPPEMEPTGCAVAPAGGLGSLALAAALARRRGRSTTKEDPCC